MCPFREGGRGGTSRGAGRLGGRGQQFSTVVKRVVHAPSSGRPILSAVVRRRGLRGQEATAALARRTFMPGTPRAQRVAPPGARTRQPILWAVATAVLLLGLLAGCVGGDSPSHADSGPEAEVDSAGHIRHDVVARHIGTPVAIDHDDRDLSLHTSAHNLEQVAWSSIGVTLGENGFANFVLRDDGASTFAYIAIDGDAQGGFNILDITDPHSIRLVGQYRTAGSGFQEVRVTPDGLHAVLNVQKLPSPTSVVGQQSPLDGCSVCIHVVSLADPGNPRLESVLPVETLGTHNMDIVDYGTPGAADPAGGLYLFFVGQPATADNLPVGNRLGIARFVDTPAGMTLVPVGTFAHPAVLDSGRSFPHDILVQMHPDGRRIAYVSHWDGGAVTFDVTNPLAPIPLGVNTEQAPSSALAIHWLTQEPRSRLATNPPNPAAGKVIAWSAPEIGELSDGTGAIRAYDATDPANLRQLGTWSLPGNLTIPGQFLLSPHTVAPDMDTGLVAVSHYHAGVWVLDGTDPTHPQALAYAQPHGNSTRPYEGKIWWKKPNFDPEGFAPNVFQVRWHGGLLWVSERGTGLYAYRYTGPVPGPM